MSDFDRLRAFAIAVLNDFPDSAPDGCEIHDLAIKHGLLIGEDVTQPCSEGCRCAEYGDFPQTCYRRSPVLTGRAP